MKVEARRASYGSLPWFAVPSGTMSATSIDAVWLDSGERTIATQDGPVTTDGAVRFFARKRDLVAAIERTTGIEL